MNVLQVTDLHLFADSQACLMGVNTEDSFHQVMDQAKQYQSWPPDLILLTGDLAQEASKPCYQKLQLFLSKLDIPCFCLPGNHDETTLMQTELHRGNVQVTFQAWQRDWLILCLNSRIVGEEGGALSDVELDKLETCLLQHPDKPTLIALHHHPLPVNSTWMDTMVLANSVELFAKLAKYPQVRLLLCGHIHQQWAVRQGGIQVLGCPSTCFQFKPASSQFAIDEQAPGFRWLQLQPEGHFETEIIRLKQIPSGLDRVTTAY